MCAMDEVRDAAGRTVLCVVAGIMSQEEYIKGKVIYVKK